MAFPQCDKDRVTSMVTAYTSNPADAATYAGSGLKTIVDGCLSPAGPAGGMVLNSLNALPLPEQTKFRWLIWLLKETYPGLDETIDGRVTYRGFNFRTNGAALLARAQEAMAQVQQLATACNTMVGTISFGGGATATADAAFAREKFKLWFDESASYRRLEKVKTTFRKLSNAVNNEDFEIVCDADPTLVNGPCGSKPDWFGFVVKADARNRFYLSKLFFDGLSAEITGTCSFVTPAAGKNYQQTRDNVLTALNAATVTMLHELTHIRAIGDTNDEPTDPYNETVCLQNARTQADIACNNAENYSLFAKAVLLRRRFPPPATRAVRI
jgi:hypothetical protein